MSLKWLDVAYQERDVVYRAWRPTSCSIPCAPIFASPSWWNEWSPVISDSRTKIPKRSGEAGRGRWLPSVEYGIQDISSSLAHWCYRAVVFVGGDWRANQKLCTYLYNREVSKLPTVRQVLCVHARWAHWRFSTHRVSQRSRGRNHVSEMPVYRTR